MLSYVFHQQMPLRQKFLTKPWLAIESYVLPIFAPRVFQPWPNTRRGIHTPKARTGDKNHGHLHKHLDRSNQAEGQLWTHMKTPENKDYRLYPLPNATKPRTSNEQTALDDRWQELTTWLKSVTTDATHCSQKIDSSYEPQVSPQLLVQILGHVGKRSVFCNNWPTGFWSEVMVGALYLHPDKALGFLEVSINEGHQCIPFRALPNVLDFIIDHHFKRSTAGTSNKIEVGKRIHILLHDLPGHAEKSISNHSMFLLMSNIPKTSLKDLYFTLSRLNSNISPNTLIQFASRLAKAGETDLAFDIVQRLEERKLNFNNFNMATLCTTVVQKLLMDPDSEYNAEEALQLMHSAGLQSNVFLLSVLIQNATRSGDPETAWKIHDTMIEKGILPNGVSYSILLNDAKWRMDAAAIRLVMSYVQQSELATVHIVTDILHAIFLLHEYENRGSVSEDQKNFRPAFDRMLQVYLEYFCSEPLLQIIPGLADFCLPQTTDALLHKPLWNPHPATLVVMITAYLSFATANSSKVFYDHFRALVLAGNPAVEPLVSTTYIYNVILLCFSKFEERAVDAPNVIADMLSSRLDLCDSTSNSSLTKQNKMIHTDTFSVSRSQGISFDHTSNTRPHKPPYPDSWTWSILLKIFVHRRQMRAAERVMRLMLVRNIKPTIVTWNTLIWGYAHIQDVDMVADTMRRLNEAGHRPDDITYRALDRVINKERLKLVMKSGRKAVDPPEIGWMEGLMKDTARSFRT